MTQQATTTAAATLSSELPAWQQARRLRIIKAANAALKEQEYEQIQIRDVANGAGVALGTLYRYFSSKEHLYAAVLLDWAAPAYARSGEELSEHQIRAKMNAVISSFERRPHFFKVHVILQSSADPNAKALLAQFFEVCQHTLADDFARLGPEAAKDAAIMLWSIINTVLTGTVYNEGSMDDVYRLCNRFIDFLFGAPIDPSLEN
ncbi:MULTISPECIES: TetR/AcrR family transcriptional regulator [Actinomycetes]|uniref:TetR family transcriptional regulator n=1 Tax=Williamsia marianensis TaxID=85044 RepID=A0A2G3PSJ6_WILMA|nr:MULTISPECIES: TetR/AcrR family transcriptional regulator [Actinomycetes]MCK0518188.1 TetR family transcriptional regulator [Williamsia sp. DF01-3]MDV7134058.1 TetR/AcrR family transcriptional regulator [Williamsia muralis]PHV68838.1 TetR/AcrR family transcriptional regulator [Williamsia marianensis]PVY31325.1 TetR family transcriptional regulator [Williamsia marianensis]RKR96110.1 TetR family transcriptional regulator [Williamsia muralis]